MSRDEGFANADVSTSMLEDAKFRALWYALRKPALMSQAVTLYLSVLLASWRSGRRLTLRESVPLWFGPTDKLEAALTDARLLGPDSKIPEQAWASWYGTASGRRQLSRARYQRGNERRRRGDREVGAMSPPWDTDMAAGWEPPDGVETPRTSHEEGDAATERPRDDGGDPADRLARAGPSEPVPLHRDRPNRARKSGEEDVDVV